MPRLHLESIQRSAETSPCGKYRWWLERRWEEGGNTCCFVMLHPSVADGDHDDPTLRRCMGFAQYWGFNALLVKNLFPWRAVNTKELKRAALKGEDIRGGERGDNELVATKTAGIVIAAWGDYRFAGRAYQFLRLTDPVPIYCIASHIKGGGILTPCHPLRLAASLWPINFARNRKKSVETPVSPG